MKWTRPQLPYADSAVPLPKPGIPVRRTPFSMIENSSPSESDCVAARVMSGAFGYICLPIPPPLPSLPWQPAQ
jgi:hypothetical protein